MLEPAVLPLLIKLLRKEPLDLLEQVAVEEWAGQSPLHRKFLDEIRDGQVNEELEQMRERPKEAIWENIQRRLAKRKERRAFIARRMKWAAAAAVVILIGIGPALRKMKGNKQQEIPPAIIMSGGHRPATQELASLSSMTTSVDEVLSGDHKEMLTLGDGRSVYPDGLHGRVIVIDGKNQVGKMDSNELSYLPRVPVFTGSTLGGSLETGSVHPAPAHVPPDGSATANKPAQAMVPQVAWNTLAVGQAGPFALLLADGTRVWLNARSALSYPTAFAGSSRVVRLIGQARFEVAKDPGRPFIVQSKNMNTEAVGTSFTITAYPGEPGDKVTLWEGSIHVENDKGAYLLKNPLQQAQAQSGGAVVPMQDLKDPAAATAWQRGVFHFSGTDIQTAMSQIAHWYGMEIRYEGEVRHLQLRMEGDIGHDLTLPQLLGIINRFEKNITVCAIRDHAIVVSDTRTGD